MVHNRYIQRDEYTTLDTGASETVLLHSITHDIGGISIKTLSERLSFVLTTVVERQSVHCYHQRRRQVGHSRQGPHYSQ